MDMELNPKKYLAKLLSRLYSLLIDKPYLPLPFIILILLYPLSFMKPMPLWTDTGEWLKYAKAYEAVFLKAIGVDNEFVESVERVMGEHSPFGYPPISLLLISLFRHMFGDIYGIHLYGVVITALIPLAMYSLAYEVTGSKTAALYTGVASAFAPIYQEIFAWGGYPNLTAMIFLAYTFKYLWRWLEKGVGYQYAILFGVATVFTHHLSTAILLATLLGAAILLTILRRIGDAKKVGLVFLTTLITFIGYRSLFQYLGDYIWFNEAAFYDLRVNLVDAFLYAYKTNILALLVTVTTLYILFDLLDTPRLFSILGSWIAAPLILSQAYIFGLSIDFARFIFFLAQPVALTLGVGVTRLGIRHWLELVIQYRRRIGAIIFIALLTISLAATVEAGISTVDNIDKWYQSIDRYNVWSRRDALEWILTNTSLDDVFAADDVMGRWIEGYTLRDTYIALHPRWLFRVGQEEEYYISSAILYSKKTVLTPYYRLLIQGELNPRWLLLLEVYGRGAYRDLLSIPMTDVVEYDYVSGEQRLLNPLYNDTSPYGDTYLISYEEGWIRVSISDYSLKSFKVSISWSLELNESYIGIPIKTFEEYRGFRIMDDEVVILTSQGRVKITVDGAEDIFELPWEPGKLLFITSGELELTFEVDTPASDIVDDVEVIEVGELIKDLGVTYIVAPGSSLGDKGDRQYFLRKLYEVAYYNGGVVIYRV